MKENLRTGENFSFDQLFANEQLDLSRRVALLSAMMVEYDKPDQNPYHRVLNSPMNREVSLLKGDGAEATSLMFGSNNYLGFASHPHVAETIRGAIDVWGSGLAGPPHLNGYTSTARELERRLAAFKGKEDAMLFSSGFAANLAVAASLAQPRDIFLYDEHSHASLIDGIRLSQARARRFRHSDVAELGRLISGLRLAAGQDLYVGVEGVYSMLGDIAPLDEIAHVVRASGGILILDDAHGSGVLGNTGRGTADHFGVTDKVDLIVGTFSKTFAVTGGFIAGDKARIDYLRYAARSYMFSAGMPPFAIAAVHAGLDLLEAEPLHRERLHENIAYAQKKLNSLPYGFDLELTSPIISLPAPVGMNVREATCRLNSEGIFVNPVEYPAVPSNSERFRISLSAAHRHDDIDKLTTELDKIWKRFAEGELRK